MTGWDVASADTRWVDNNDSCIICCWSSNQLWKNWKISSHLSLLHVFIWPHTQGSTSTPWPDAHETMKRCPSTNDADKKTLRHVMSCHAIKFVTSCLNWYCIVRCFNHMLISLKNTCFCITTYRHILVIVAQFMLVNANGTFIFQCKHPSVERWDFGFSWNTYVLLPPLRRRMFARFTTMVFDSNHTTQTTQFLAEFAFNSEVLNFLICFGSDVIRFI